MGWACGNISPLPKKRQSEIVELRTKSLNYVMDMIRLCRNAETEIRELKSLTKQTIVDVQTAGRAVSGLHDLAGELSVYLDERINPKQDKDEQDDF